MPSTLLGAQSGGVVLVSGNPYGANRNLGTPVVRGIYLRLASTSSGNAYWGYSGDITVTSGGALASGGMRDGFEIRPGDAPITIKLPPDGPDSVVMTVASTVSGFVRAFWTPTNEVVG